MPAALLFALVAALLALGWVVGTQPGTRWALQQAQSAAAGRLRVEGLSGTLLAGVAIERLRYDDESVRVQADGVRSRIHVTGLLGGQLMLQPLAVQSLEVEILDGQTRRSERLALPFGVRVADASVARLDIVRAESRQRFTQVRIDEASLGANSIRLAGALERPDERYPLRMQGEARGTFEQVHASLRWQLAGIPGEGTFELAPSAEVKLKSIDAKAGPFDLATFAPVPRTELRAQLKATGTSEGFSGTLRVENALSGPLDAGRLPVRSLQATFTTQQLASAVLDRLSLNLHQRGALEGRGRLDAQRLTASLEASAIDLKALRSTLNSTALAGPLKVELERERQTAHGKLSQPGMQIEADVIRAGANIDVVALRAQAAGGELSGKGRVVLGAPPRFEAVLDFRRFDPSAFGRYPQGTLSGSLRAKGALAEPMQADVEWKLAQSIFLGLPASGSGGARLSARRVQNLSANLRLGASRITLQGALGHRDDRLAWALSVPRLQELAAQIAGSAEARGVLAGSWEDPRIEAALQADEVQLPQQIRLRALSATLGGTAARHELRLAGRAAEAQFAAEARGSYDRERGWAGEISSASNKGTYPLRLVAPAPLRLSRERVELGRLEAELGAGRLLVREARWQQGRLASSGEFSGLPAQWLILAGGLSERLRASMLLDGNWSLAAAPLLDGSLRIRRRSGDLELLGEHSTPLGLSEAILDSRFSNGRMSGRLDADSRYGSLALEGGIEREPDARGVGFGPASPVSFKARLDFAELPVFAQPFLLASRLDGRIGAELQGSGTLRAPQLKGSVRGDGISFESPPYGVFLRNGQLRATLEGDRLAVQSFTIQGGAGSLTASGTLPLRFAEGGASLDWQAHNFSALERPDMRLVASGSGRAAYDGERVALTGNVRADSGRLSFDRDRLPKLGEDVIVLGKPRTSPAGRTRLPVDLDLQLDLGPRLQVQAQGLEGRLEGNVQLATAPDGELRAYGQVTMVNATFFAYGQRLQVDPGLLIFDGALDNPSLQVTAWRRNLAVEPGVQVTGSLRAPRVQLVSQPPVSEGERLSWLVLGRAPSDATKADLGLLQAAAGALLARGESMPLDRRIARSFGLDEVSFRGSGEVQDRVVAFGKRLSDRLYVSYEQGLGQVASNLVKLDFSLGRRWSLRAETGTTSGAGLFYRFSWD